jgi:hypothetical protein
MAERCARPPPHAAGTVGRMTNRVDTHHVRHSS